MENKDRTVTVAVITGVVALLLGCCLGAMAGAMGGYFIGHQAGSRWDERMAPDSFEMPMLPDLAGTQGALVQEVVAGSPAEAAGVQVGDIITEVDGTPIDAQPPAGGCCEPVPARRPRQTPVWRTGDAKSVTVTLGENPQDSARPYLGVRYADFADRPDNTAPND